MRRISMILGILIALLIPISCGLFPPDRTTETDCGYEIIECPDGEPVVIQDIDKAFPVYTGSLNTNSNFVIENMDKIRTSILKNFLIPKDLEINGEFQCQGTLDHIFSDLSQENIMIHDSLRNALIENQREPCNRIKRDNLENIITSINTRAEELNKIGKRLEELSSQQDMKPEDLLNYLKKLQSDVNNISTTNVNKSTETRMIDKIDSLRSEISKVNRALTRYALTELFYESGEASLSSNSKQLISAIESILLRNKDKEILILGYADDVPIGKNLTYKYKDNYELSRARAKTVGTYLIDQLNIECNRINICGLSNHYPLSLELSEESRQQNRRVEIYLTAENDLVVFPIEKCPF
jgi:flagellar motor protein MotB